MELKKNPKANVGRNSSLYFAVGLNVMLVLTYLGLEHKTYETEAIQIDILMLDDLFNEDIPITTIEITPPPPEQKQIIVEVITIVEDIVDVEESVIKSTEAGQDDSIEDREVGIEDVAVVEVDEDIEVPFAVIEQVPIFPGCTGNNAQLKACFQEKMQEHLQKHFLYPEAAKELDIQGKVFVFFFINKNGKVAKIKSRGPDQLLEEESERIISLLPVMKPGKQRNKAVRMPYSIPINFQLRQH
jgi:protein TonB